MIYFKKINITYKARINIVPTRLCEQFNVKVVFILLSLKKKKKTLVKTSFSIFFRREDKMGMNDQFVLDLRPNHKTFRPLV